MIRSARIGSKQALRPVSKYYGSVVSHSVAVKNLHTTSKKQIAKEPEEVFTKLSDENDPNRESFFNYTWGSWLKNDAEEKKKRVTKFSLEGLTKVLNDIYKQSAALGISDAVQPPSYNQNLTVTLPHNLSSKFIGEGPKTEIKIKTMSSIHEGKHHRIYKLDTDNGKSFILRVPYPKETEVAIAERLKSEVATQDFADLQLKIKVPKIFCFGVNSMNPVRAPFILQEFIEGDLLMKDWDPLVDDSALEGKPHEEKLNKVIKPLADYQAKLASVEFSKHGSLYFAKDVSQDKSAESHASSTEDLFTDESKSAYKGRWAVGPTQERGFWRSKDLLTKEVHSEYLGPWNSSSKILSDLAELELANSKAKLNKNTESTILQNQVKTFENLTKLAPALFNEKSKNIPNVEKLFKPRLQHPDLDPMNVIVNEKGEKYLIDFEGSVIKPFMYNIQPQFVAYEGPKLYKFDQESEEFKKLNDQEKEQYKFMYKRTRNLYLWEFALNSTAPELIYSVAPQMKLLKAPIIATLNKRADEDYIFVDEKMIQLKSIWELMAKNQLVNAETFPLTYTDKDIEDHTAVMMKNNEELIKSPFAVTQGWIPADMFENLVQQQILIKQENGDYEFNASGL